MWISPDSGRVVFAGDDPVDGNNVLYSAPLPAGSSVALHGPAAASGDRPGPALRGGRVELSADGDNVFFLAEDVAGISGLYRVPIGGGDLLAVRRPTALDDGVHTFRLAPDGQRVVTSTWTGPDSRLHAVPAAGGLAVELDALGLSWHDTITPDSGSVICTQGRGKLFNVPLDGGGAITLFNEPSTPSIFALSNRAFLTPDGSRVVYQVDLQADRTDEWYSIPTAGGTAERMDDPGRRLRDPVLSGDGRFVVARTSEFVDGLWSLPVDGSSAICLNDDLYQSGDCDSLRRFEVTPDGQRVVFQAGRRSAAGELYACYSVAAAGGPAVLLRSVPEPLAMSYSWSYELAVTDTHAVQYDRVAWEGGSWSRLAIDPLAGGAPTVLWEPLPDDGVLYRLLLTPDERYALCVTGDRIYAVPVAGGEPVLLTDPLPEGAEICRFRAPEVSPDSSTVLYWVGAEELGGYQLYAAPIPEPGMLALTALAGACLLRRRRG